MNYPAANCEVATEQGNRIMPLTLPSTLIPFGAREGTRPPKGRGNNKGCFSCKVTRQQAARNYLIDKKSDFAYHGF
jgi:hypothetical protein